MKLTGYLLVVMLAWFPVVSAMDLIHKVPDRHRCYREYAAEIASKHCPRYDVRHLKRYLPPSLTLGKRVLRDLCYALLLGQEVIAAIQPHDDRAPRAVHSGPVRAASRDHFDDVVSAGVSLNSSRITKCEVPIAHGICPAESRELPLAGHTVASVLPIASKTSKHVHRKRSCGPDTIGFEEVKTLDILKQQLSTLNEANLVIFDVDEVLTTPAGPWLRGNISYDDKMISAIYNRKSSFSTTVDRATKDHLWQTYMQTFPNTPLAKDAPAIIKELQDRKINVIALTGMWVNAHNLEIEASRSKELASFGIDFRGPFSTYDGIVLPACVYQGRSPVFKDGILYTAVACTKGAVLKEFFKVIGWYPKRVIAIDDSRDNLMSMSDAMCSLQIEYQGLHYLAANDLPASYDKDASEFQLQYAMEHGQWLSIPQVRTMIGTKK